MIPKEKATALTQKYFDEVTDHMTWEQAKQCALIATNQIFNLDFPIGGDVNEFLDYWNEVRKELESL